MFEWHELPHCRIRSDITPTPLHNHAAREHYLSVSPDISLVIPWFPPRTGLAIANPVLGRGSGQPERLPLQVAERAFKLRR